MKSIASYSFSVSALLFFMGLSQMASSINKNRLDKIPKEKIYVHFDKSVYNSGDNIWYKVYLVDAIHHTPKTLSSVVYVDLIDPKNNIIDSKTIKINEGSGNGDFNLPQRLLKGKYTIRAYTNFMRNFDSEFFFRKTILIDTKTHQEIASSRNKGHKDQPNMYFFPEGGHIVSGFVNSIGVKVINDAGKGMAISGVIMDESNNTIRTFETSKLGQGMFQFIPEKGKQYRAFVSYQGENYTYSLPRTLDNGVLMRVHESNDFFRINIYSSLNNSTNGLKLIGLQKGDIVCQTELNGNKSEMAINVPKSDLKPGLVEFRLLDENDAVLSKELTFSYSNNYNKKISVKASKTVYNRNEKVEIDLNLSELVKKNEVANMSISVSEAPPLQTLSHSTDIKTHLFLSSEVSEYIEHPGYYMSSSDAQKKNDLNLLLRSQNINPDLFKDVMKDNPLRFTYESGLNLSGTVKGRNNKEVVKAIVTISYKNSDDLGYDQVVTDSLGRFKFEGLHFDKRTFVALKAKNLNSEIKSKNLVVILDSIPPPNVNPKATTPRDLSERRSQKLKHRTKQSRNLEFAPQEGEIKLKEVNLKATKKRLNRYSKKREFSLYGTPTHTLDVRNSNIIVINPLMALQGKFPGIDVVGDYIIIRGERYYIGPEIPGESDASPSKRGPLFLVDGFPSDFDFVSSMSIHDIDFIDVSIGRTAAYGARGGAAIIAIYTLNGSEEDDKPNDKNEGLSFYHPGYYQARKFSQNTDNSSTLYWNPNVRLEASNSTKITFNTANKSASYKVLLEGITSQGTPFKAEAYFEVN